MTIDNIRISSKIRHSRGVNFALGLPSSKLPTFSESGNPVGLNKCIFVLLDSRFHPQGVRRGCKGLKPQQHTQRGNDPVDFYRRIILVVK